MKKTLLITVLVLICLALLAWIGWMRKTGIAEQMLQKHLGVPVSLKSLEINKQGAVFSNLIIRNPRGYKSPSAFAAQSIEIDTTLKALWGNPLTINRIEISNILLTIEQSKSGKTNWDQILGKAPSKKPIKRKWLIKSLILNNLTVQVMKPNGEMKQYPTLSRMEFYNLSEETGFPVDAIERAILNEVIKNILRNFNLQNLLHPLMPPGLPVPSFF